MRKVNKANLYRLGAQENSVGAFICGASNGSICGWSFTTDQLVEPGLARRLFKMLDFLFFLAQFKSLRFSLGAKPLELLPFLRISLSDAWSSVSQQLPTETGFFNVNFF